MVLVGARYRDRGLIGRVERVQEDGQCVYVEGVEMVSFLLFSSSFLSCKYV